jgi:hypothetical protein
MAIVTFDDYIGSAKQALSINKLASRTAIAAASFSVFDLSGNPGAGVLPGSSVAAGVVPNNLTAGCPLISAFGVSAVGYLTQLEYGNTVACRLKLYDMLFKAGAYAFNAAQTLAAQPSYATRAPGGNFVNTQLFLECVTAFTGNPTVTVTYTNQAGTAGRTTGAIALGLAPTVGRLIQLPLAAGDSGIQKVESVTATVATVGTFNILVMRPLAAMRCRSSNEGDIFDYARLGPPVVFADSALYLSVTPDSTATGLPEIEFVIANK